jgi:hypothetical protein
MVQFADLHFGEAPNMDWGPQQARNLSLASTRRIRMHRNFSSDCTIA